MQFFFDFLEKLRQKNEAQKAVISFVSAIVITFIITVTWFTWTLTKEKKQEVVAENKKSDVTPMANLSSQMAEIKSMFGEAMEQFKYSKEIIKNISEITEEIEEN